MFSESTLFYCAAWYLAFLFSTTVHEASHAVVALKLGDDTAQRGGQVTLDPIPHIMREPVGMVIVPLLSFFMSGWMLGWASAPYDPDWAERNPKRAALMALAGPASNLLLCATAFILIRAGMVAGWFHAPDGIHGIEHLVAANHNGAGELFAVFLGILFYLNLILFAFNLIPLPPLDGSSVPLLFLSDAAADSYTRFMKSPGMSMVGMILAWQFFGPVATKLFGWAIHWLYPAVY